MPEVITIGPSDIEVDHSHIDPIIHFYPGVNDPDSFIHDLIQGLFLLHNSSSLGSTLDNMICSEKDETKKKMLIVIRDNNQKNLEESEDYAKNFYKKISFK